MAITILGALRKRDATGKGRRLQVAMQDAMMHYMRVRFAHPGLTGKAQRARRQRAGRARERADRGCIRASPAGRTTTSIS